LKPILTGIGYTVKSQIENKRSPFYEVSAVIEPAQGGRPLAKATATLFNPSPEIAAKLIPDALELTEFQEMLAK
jgi:hypothetical protein